MVMMRMTDHLHPPPAVQLPAGGEEDAGPPLPGGEVRGGNTAHLHLHLQLGPHTASHWTHHINQAGAALNTQLDDVALCRVLNPVNGIGGPTDVVPRLTVVHRDHLEAGLTANQLDPPGRAGVEPLDGRTGTAVRLTPQHGAGVQLNAPGHGGLHSHRAGTVCRIIITSQHKTTLQRIASHKVMV